MASIGLLKPRVAKYTETDGVVTYSGLKVLAKAISHDLALNNTDPVVLYADDGAAESVGGFSSGTLTLGVDKLPADICSMIFGIELETSTTPAGSIISFDDDVNPPDLGYGVIVPKIRGGVKTWMAIIFTKIKFAYPGESFATKGESIEFGTPELTATVMRDGTPKHTWRKWAEFGTEEAADTWLNTQLGQTGDGE